MIKLRIAKSTRCRGENSIYISFPFNMEIVDKLRAYPNRYWNPDTKEWEVPYLDMMYIESDFRNYETTIVDERERTADAEQSVTKSFDLSKYKFKTPPFNHQIEGIQFGLEKSRWLLGDEQGLGKTKQAIDIACIKKKEMGFEHCLIVCGVNGLKWNWKKEITVHSNESSHILGERVSKGKTVVKGNAEKLADLKNIRDIDSYFLITNVETLRNKEVNEILVKLCKNGTISMVVADEVHKMKNPTSQQGKAFLKLNSDYKLAMTGTPLMNSPLDLYIILKWLEYDEHAFYAFKNHYCIMGGFGGHEIVGYRNLGELSAKLDGMMLRRLKEDVLDLPEKTHIDEYVDMTLRQEQIYIETKNHLRANIDKIANAVDPLSEMIRLRQATGYTGILSTTIAESAKIDRAIEIVADAVDNGKKVVLFSNWTSITDEVYERLSKRWHGVMITGKTKDNERIVNVDRFQNDPNCKFIIGTTGAMGTGLTLTAGTVEIFFDEPWNDAFKVQAEDRCHRIGQKSNVTIYTLMCKNTIDEWVHNIVLAKGDMSKLIVDGKPVTNRLSYVQYLLQ